MIIEITTRMVVLSILEILFQVNFEKGLQAVEELKKILPQNFKLSQLALKWILMHEEVTVVIPGAINSFQVKRILPYQEKMI